jgi:putative glutamine transport system permease protein
VSQAEIVGHLLQGLRTTVWLSVLSGVFSLLFGTLIGVLRVAPLLPVAAVAQGYIQFFRNIPLLIVLFFALNGLPKMGITFGFFATAVVGLTAYTSAYVAEVVRAGLQSLSRGQMEAARSLGFSWVGAMAYVLLPQVFRTIVPPLGNLFSALIRNTSLAGSVGVAELIYQADFIEGRTFSPNIFIIAGLMYLLLTVPLGFAINFVESRLSLARLTR